ncbi:hypothetical protein K458DRAFT_437229 [Lentithecium fluviatile CBS 122367]|uniref:Rhodopsin domain-containing protein n=1 Tax=Lentithecium fluviatile CBS 122367 TaxID=1168545 RepID=A0A6G1IEC0_9PLEO|nr:hypothetical protein K458DRAFT_437229 [Lentithecium fluviatile CBS 122367]
MAMTMDPTSPEYLAYLANLPAAPPPPGVLSNFDHPDTNADQGHIGMGICIALITIFMLLRIYVKSAITKMWGWDDVACILGYICIVAHDIVAFTIMGPGKWLGLHQYDIRAMSITKSYIVRVLVTLNLYAGGAFFVKLSLFLLYLRLFKPNALTRWLVYIGIAACGIMYSVSIILNTVLVVPSKNEGDSTLAWTTKAQKFAGPSLSLAIAQGAFGSVSDIYLLVVPVQSVFNLHMPTSRKLGVSAIFMTGLVAIGCSLGSLVYRVKLLQTTDDMWISLIVYTFSSAEISAGIICACMPICASLFKLKDMRMPSSMRYFRSWRASRKSASEGTDPKGSKGSSKKSKGFPSNSSEHLYISKETALSVRSGPPSSEYVSHTDYIELERGVNFK